MRFGSISVIPVRQPAGAAASSGSWPARAAAARRVPPGLSSASAAARGTRRDGGTRLAIAKPLYTSGRAAPGGQGATAMYGRCR